jgi:hypothetical protein
MAHEEYNIPSGIDESNLVHKNGDETINGTKTFTSRIEGTIDKSKDYYLSDGTLASANGSLGIVKYYYVGSTADLDTEIFEHSLWHSGTVTNSIPSALDSFYYIDQYFFSSRTATSNRIQILRGYKNANLHMVRVYDNKTNSWSEWEKFANDSNVVHKSGDETIAGTKTFSSNIVGNLTGNADTATKATQDSDGNKINKTYAKDSNVVHNSGDETISGAKAFNGTIISNYDLTLQRTNGAELYLFPYNHGSYPGSFLLRTVKNAEKDKFIDFWGKTNGSLTWDGKNIVRSINNTSADSAGNVTITYVSNAEHAYKADFVNSYSGTNVIAFNWSDQVSGFVGLKVDSTEAGGIVTTNNLPSLLGGIGVYDIGSTIHACTGAQVAYGGTVAGSQLKYAALDAGGGIYDLNHQLTTVGTWLKVSGNSSNTGGFGLYRRIA